MPDTDRKLLSKPLPEEKRMSKFGKIGMCLLLSACTVGPDYKRPEFFNDEELRAGLHLNKNVKTETKVNLDWYADFNDEVLNQLVAKGFQNSPTIAEAVAKLRESRQSLRVNAVSMLPEINIDGSYHKSKDSVSYGIPLTTDYYQTGLDASWEIDIWGAGRRLTESSLALVRAAAADLDNVRLSLTAEIANDYISLRQTQEQLRISRGNLEIQRNIYNLVKQKYEAGLSSAIDYNQAGYIMENTAAQIPALETQEEAYRNALAVLTGGLPGSLDTLLAQNKNNPVSRRFDYNLGQLYNLPVEIVRRRPDVQAAEQQLISQNAQIGQAMAALFPSVSLSGFLGWQAQNASDLFGSKTDMYSYAGAVNIPLLNWGKLTNNVEMQKYAAQAQLEVYRGSLLNAASEIRNAIVSLEKEYRTNRSASAALSAQQETAALTLDKYKQGLVEFSEVLTSQQNLLTAQTALIESNAAIYQDIIGFYKSVGGGYAKNYQPRTAAANKACAPCKG